MSYRYPKYEKTISGIYLISELILITAILLILLKLNIYTAVTLSATVTLIMFLLGDYTDIPSRYWGQNAIMVLIHIPIAVLIYFIIYACYNHGNILMPKFKFFTYITIDIMIGITILRTAFNIYSNYQFTKGRWYYNRIIVTSDNDYSKELSNIDNKMLNNHFSYINIDENNEHTINTIASSIIAGEVDEIFWAIDATTRDLPPVILHNAIEKGVVIKQLSSEALIILGTASLHRPNYNMLLQYKKKDLLPWESAAKWLTDKILSIIGLLISLPFIPFIIASIKHTSEGPIFYIQDRIGKNRKPFKILKFRTMYIDAEKDGPALSSANDERITPTGRFLRKWRIDEIPQFLNVLRGEMSLVGPRPEREHYINIIKEQTPHIINYLTVKPGITSLGMVKFGYAENIEEMRRRFKYDLYYINNRSYYLDLKIIALTLNTLVSGRGK